MREENSRPTFNDLINLTEPRIGEVVAAGYEHAVCWRPAGIPHFTHALVDNCGDLLTLVEMLESSGRQVYVVTLGERVRRVDTASEYRARLAHSERDTADTNFMLQFFTYEHLPTRLQATSKPFDDLAQTLAAMTEAELAEEAELIREHQLRSKIITLICEMEPQLPTNVEATWAINKIYKAGKLLVAGEPLHLVLRKLLEGKDCAVRSLLVK